MHRRWSTWHNADPPVPSLRPKKLKLLPAIALVAGATALGACGDSGKPDEAKGKQLFTQKCGACHVLQNAGTKGVQGPNLDSPSRSRSRTGSAAARSRAWSGSRSRSRRAA